ncbi:hypothetical protein [Leifsonia aquatica]|uniref:hypothetical protein n=1 Tax=Leifsonia aquatica TaxID=144185 RepID=UPI001F0603C1|nr:hypothetical protein [Leifsonia aquatica]
MPIITSENAEKWMPRNHRPVPLGAASEGATVRVVGRVSVRDAFWDRSGFWEPGFRDRSGFRDPGFRDRSGFPDPGFCAPPAGGASDGSDADGLSAFGAAVGSVGRFGMAPPGWTDDTDAGPWAPHSS